MVVASIGWVLVECNPPAAGSAPSCPAFRSLFCRAHLSGHLIGQHLCQAPRPSGVGGRLARQSVASHHSAGLSNTQRIPPWASSSSFRLRPSSPHHRRRYLTFKPQAHLQLRTIATPVGIDPLPFHQNTKNKINRYLSLHHV